jgi:hypothetical protein
MDCVVKDDTTRERAVLSLTLSVEGLGERRECSQPRLLFSFLENLW